jgi:hypothetical protein
MITADELESLAWRMLHSGPNPVVRVRLLRDVLCVPSTDPGLAATKSELSNHPWAQELADEQLPDGSWGHFHSMDSSQKKRFPTSETAIRRALALGLEKDCPVLSKAIRYMEGVLAAERIWTDRVEKSEGWPIGVEAITAGTLAQVDPAHPALRRVWEYWAEVAGRSFPGGEYDPQAERQAHRELGGSPIVYLRSRYVLTLLGVASLPAELERRIIDWIWNDPQGIGYLGADLKKPSIFHIHRWLESLEILTHFPSAREHLEEAFTWLAGQRESDGRWDFGSRTSKSYDYPLSDDWHRPGSRQLDHSTWVLALLRRTAV